MWTSGKDSTANAELGQHGELFPPKVASGEMPEIDQRLNRTPIPAPSLCLAFPPCLSPTPEFVTLRIARN
jgi:hypothetical protein